MTLRLVAALLVTAAACCGRGPAPRTADDPPPADAAVPVDAALPDAAPTDAPAPVDAAPPIDAPRAIDARAPGGGSGYRIDRVIKGKITKAAGRYLTIQFEDPVERGWYGDLWDEHRDGPVAKTRFKILGIRGADGTVGVTLLERPLHEYGDYETVRVWQPSRF